MGFLKDWPVSERAEACKGETEHLMTMANMKKTNATPNYTHSINLRG